ncbi:GNAT family N-acetyltransferase [Zhouia sp. PK063]|uniref:GNAT family N-acetyltransferase n=1 Tax=Zhouia sp. PK063 TaxID=3373602 RepID=UPI0037AE6289
MKNFEIELISTLQTIHVRHEVLRRGKPVETCNFDGDNDESTTHFGAIVNHQVVGVVSLMKKNNLIFNSKKQYQLRGMAVLPEFRKLNLGKSLIVNAEVYLKNKNVDFLWMNAREIAMKFYEKNGYKIHGEQFLIPGVGPHYLMFKNL